MSRYKLRKPGQPLWLQCVLWLFEFSASLKLAVLLLLSCAVVLGWATFVESKYGLRAVHFGIYGSSWFTLLNLLLALNIFCAAAIRYPWQRHQTGFVITHIGLLTLMFGTLLSRSRGIDAQMPIWEGHDAYAAFEDSEHIELAIRKSDSAGSAADEEEQVRAVPLRTGPFNWSELDEMAGRPKWGGSLSEVATQLLTLPNRLAWRLAPRDRGVVYDEDGIRLELLDYYSNSTEIDVPAVKLRLSTPRVPRQGADGAETLSPEQWVPLELSVKTVQPEMLARRPQGIGSREQMGGGSVVYWLAGSAGEVESFLQGRPQGALGKHGQAVVTVGGASVPVAIDERLGAGRFPLGDSGLEAEVTAWYASARLKQGNGPQGMELTEGQTEGPANETSGATQPAVEIAIFRGETAAGKLVLFADLPELSQQAAESGVFGNYWFDHGKKDSAALLRGDGGARIDVLEAPDGALYYRYWNRQEVVVAERLPSDGTRVNAFKMPMGQLQMYVERHHASPTPAKRVLPVAFEPSTSAPDARRAAKLRATVDGVEQEFWLVGPPVFDAIIGQPLGDSARRVIEGKGRTVALTLPLDEVDVGFRVKLKKFERKLDPGTSQASHYSSTVDLLERDRAQRELEQDVFITMNAPIDFSSPLSGRSYRLFQESFQGPYFPGHPLFERFALPEEKRQSLAVSILTVNYDPGRGVKQLGCLLVVAGIVTMFYMRAYFFKPQAKPMAAAGRASKAKPTPVEMAS